MSANSDLPYLRRELYLIEKALCRRIPILGICLGAQLVAKALGARVYANPIKEIGWLPIYPTPAAASDPLLCHLRPVENVFHWHGETFDLPSGADCLAHSDACAHQAFRFGSTTYGLQFHPEVTPATIRDWCEHDRTKGEDREAPFPIDPELHQIRMRELAGLMFGQWLDFNR